MAIVLLIARLLLAVVFLVAGIAKFADLAGSRQALPTSSTTTSPTPINGWTAIELELLALAQEMRLFLAGLTLNPASERRTR
jgi:uncharacterized membrane protein YphA (DoxX/SURF4 family)